VNENKVYFNGVEAEVKYATPVTLGVIAPAGAGTGRVTVAVKGKTSVADVIFTYEGTLMVTTIAGSTPGYQDGPALQAKFQGPLDMVFDQQGNLYVTDRYNHRIRKISSAGEVTTLAGSGEPGFEDGTGEAASFNYPNGIAMDPQGNLVITDLGNSSIRRITPAGVVTTVAGTGEYGYVDGPAATAQFDTPEGIAVDTLGNIYVADYMNHRLRKISTSGMVSTIAGSGPLAYDGGGYVNGPALEAVLTMPRDLIVAPNGDIYFTETSEVIRKLSGGMVSHVAGSTTAGFADGPAADARFYNPWGIVMDGEGNLFIADMTNHRIRKITPDGTVSTFAGDGTGVDEDGPIETATFYNPFFLAFSPEGVLHVAGVNPVVRKIE
jgi:sugar lactone lactonase YvrE